jgi:hypothetical protein
MKHLKHLKYTLATCVFSNAMSPYYLDESRSSMPAWRSAAPHGACRCTPGRGPARRLGWAPCARRASTCSAAKRAVEAATVQASGMVERGVGKAGGVVGVKRGGPMEWWIRARWWRPSPLADPKIKLEPGRDLRHQSNHVIQSFRLSVRRPIAMYTLALEPGRAPRVAGPWSRHWPSP